VGDTLAADSPSTVSPIAGFKIPQSVVYAGIFTNLGDPTTLRSALEKLSLNDSSLIFSPENSEAFGHGFRCGFLGMLHLEIVKERLEREYNLELIVTQPSVLYKKEIIEGREHYLEPWVSLEIITPVAFIGPIMELLQSKRAIYKDTKYINDRAILEYESPLSEIIIDFYDKLKSASQGYASQNYELIGWRPGDLVKLDVLIAGDKIEEFSRIVPRERAQVDAKNLGLKLKNLIPRQMFEVAIQIAVGGKVLSRENISAMKKDVIAKLYGGDRTRKDKLLKKQAAGKKKMKQLGKIDIPSDVFVDILKS
jgi:GTP-binding protein LepA